MVARPAGGLPAANANAKKMPLIAVRGNKFVDPQGKPVLFRGVAIADPDKISVQGHWNRDLFVKISQMGARIVRIPVHPVAWREDLHGNTSSSRSGRGMVHRPGPLCGHRLALDRQSADGPLSGSDVRHIDAGDVQLLAHDCHAFFRQSHGCIFMSCSMNRQRSRTNWDRCPGTTGSAPNEGLIEHDSRLRPGEDSTGCGIRLGVRSHAAACKPDRR